MRRFLLWNVNEIEIHMCQCQTESTFGDTVYLCYCKLRLVTAPRHGGGWGDEKLLILITLDCWKRHFWEKNYIESYFYLLKSTKSTKTTSQKCWINTIWADFFGCPYHRNSIKTCLGLPLWDELCYYESCVPLSHVLGGLHEFSSIKKSI